MVRQLTISMMIRSNDEEASQVASQIFAAHKDNLAGLPAAIRSQVLINEMKQHETKDLVALYLDLYSYRCKTSRLQPHHTAQTLNPNASATEDNLSS